MSDRTEQEFLGNGEFTAEDEAAEQLGIKVALARQHLVAQCTSMAAAMLASGVEYARGDVTQDWDAIMERGFEVLDNAAKELVDTLKGTE